MPRLRYVGEIAGCSARGDLGDSTPSWLDRRAERRRGLSLLTSDLGACPSSCGLWRIGIRSFELRRRLGLTAKLLAGSCQSGDPAAAAAVGGSTGEEKGEGCLRGWPPAASPSTCAHREPDGRCDGDCVGWLSSRRQGRMGESRCPPRWPCELPTAVRRQRQPLGSPLPSTRSRSTPPSSWPPPKAARATSGPLWRWRMPRAAHARSTGGGSNG